MRIAVLGSSNWDDVLGDFDANMERLQGVLAGLEAIAIAVDGSLTLVTDRPSWGVSDLVAAWWGAGYPETEFAPVGTLIQSDHLALDGVRLAVVFLRPGDVEMLAMIRILTGAKIPTLVVDWERGGDVLPFPAKTGGSDVGDLQAA